ncbi:hypothetical protein M5G07_03170 [Serratia symbiotica]|nr:hypothetical protein [Serratia symbiotica]
MLSARANLYFLPLDLDGVTSAGWICIKGVLVAYRGFVYTTLLATCTQPPTEHTTRVLCWGVDASDHCLREAESA